MMATNTAADAEKLFGTTVHSAIMSEIRLDSHLTKVLLQNVERIQHRRARQLARHIEDRQREILTAISPQPPAGFLTDNKYAQFKEEYKQMKTAESRVWLQSYLSKQGQDEQRRQESKTKIGASEKSLARIRRRNKSVTIPSPEVQQFPIIQ